MAHTTAFRPPSQRTVASVSLVPPSALPFLPKTSQSKICLACSRPRSRQSFFAFIWAGASLATTEKQCHLETVLLMSEAEFSIDPAQRISSSLVRDSARSFWTGSRRFPDAPTDGPLWSYPGRLGRVSSSLVACSPVKTPFGNHHTHPLSSCATEHNTPNTQDTSHTRVFQDSDDGGRFIGLTTAVSQLNFWRRFGRSAFTGEYLNGPGPIPSPSRVVFMSRLLTDRDVLWRMCVTTPREHNFWVGWTVHGCQNDVQNAFSNANRC